MSYMSPYSQRLAMEVERSLAEAAKPRPLDQAPRMKPNRPEPRFTIRRSPYPTGAIYPWKLKDKLRPDFIGHFATWEAAFGTTEGLH